MNLREHAIAVLAALSLLPTLASAADPAPASITIAPARSDSAKAIKEELQLARDAGGAEELAVYFAYGGRGFEPIWVTRSANDDSWAISPKARGLQTLFDDAAEWGLNPSDYQLDLPAIINAETAVSAEIAITRAALRFGLDNYGGRLDPRSISSNLDMPQPRPDYQRLAVRLASSNDPAALLTGLAPKSSEFVAILAALRTADDIGTRTAIADGPSIKPGADDPRVAQVRQRLSDGPAAIKGDSLYDDTLVEAVRSFQTSVGLTADGVIGPATLEALNRAGPISRDVLLANLEKWRWMPRERGTYRVEVNIPEYRLRVRRAETVVYETRVVVGTPANQTAIFYDQIRHVVVNPYWNVPGSIVRNEIAPQILRDPGYLDRRQFELLRDGKLVDPWSVDWSLVDLTRFPFAVRQQPGAQNALGQVKFLFPNKHDIYLHDTPEKGLFARDSRAFSHGCVRVQDPFEFANVLLAEEPSFGRDDLEAAFGPKERWFNMEVKVPVYLTYFTVRAGEDGRLTAYADVYGHDRAIIAALRGNDL